MCVRVCVCVCVRARLKAAALQGKAGFVCVSVSVCDCRGQSSLSSSVACCDSRHTTQCAPSVSSLRLSAVARGGLQEARLHSACRSLPLSLSSLLFLPLCPSSSLFSEQRSRRRDARVRAAAGLRRGTPPARGRGPRPPPVASWRAPRTAPAASAQRPSQAQPASAAAATPWRCGWWEGERRERERGRERRKEGEGRGTEWLLFSDACSAVPHGRHLRTPVYSHMYIFASFAFPLSLSLGKEQSRRKEVESALHLSQLLHRLPPSFVLGSFPPIFPLSSPQTSSAALAPHAPRKGAPEDARWRC